MRNLENLINLQLHIESYRPDLIDTFEALLFDNGIVIGETELSDAQMKPFKDFISSNYLSYADIGSKFGLNESDCVKSLSESKQTVADTAKEIYGTLEDARKAFKDDYKSFYSEMSAVLDDEEDVKLIDSIFNVADVSESGNKIIKDNWGKDVYSYFEQSDVDNLKEGDVIEIECSDNRSNPILAMAKVMPLTNSSFKWGFQNPETGGVNVITPQKILNLKGNWDVSYKTNSYTIKKISHYTNGYVNLNESFEIKPTFYEDLKKYNDISKSQDSVLLRDAGNALKSLLDGNTLMYVANNEDFSGFEDFITSVFDDSDTNLLFSNDSYKDLFKTIFGSKDNYKNAIVGLTSLMISRLEDGTLQHVNFGDEMLKALIPINITPSELLESKNFVGKILSCNESVVNSIMASNRHIRKSTLNECYLFVNNATNDVVGVVSKDYRHCVGDIFNGHKLNESKSYVALKRKIKNLNEDAGETLSDIGVEAQPLNFDITGDFLDWLIGSSYSSQDLNDFLINNAEKIADSALDSTDEATMRAFMAANGDDLDALIGLYHLKDNVKTVNGVQYVVEDKLGETRTTEITPLGGLNADIANVLSEEILQPEFGEIVETDGGCYIADACEKSVVTRDELVKDFGILGQDAEDVVNILNDVYTPSVNEYVLNESFELPNGAYKNKFGFISDLKHIDLYDISTLLKGANISRAQYALENYWANNDFSDAFYKDFSAEERNDLIDAINLYRSKNNISESKKPNNNGKDKILFRLFESRKLSGFDRLWKLHESVDAPIQTYADMIAYNADGKVLLLQRNPDCGFEPNKWGFAGGKVQVGEITKQGAIRECLEESGVNIDPETVEKVGEFSNPDGSVSHYYKGTALNDVVLGDESQNFLWADPSDVVNYDLIMGNKDRFNLVVNGVRAKSLNENRKELRFGNPAERKIVEKFLNDNMLSYDFGSDNVVAINDTDEEEIQEIIKDLDKLGVKTKSLNEGLDFKNISHFDRLDIGDIIQDTVESNGDLFEVTNVLNNSAFIKPANDPTAAGAFEIKSLVGYQLKERYNRDMSVSDKLYESLEPKSLDDFENKGLKDAESALMDNRFTKAVLIVGKYLHGDKFSLIKVPDNEFEKIEKLEKQLDGNKIASTVNQIYDILSTTKLDESSAGEIISSLASGDLGEIANLIASPKKYAKASLGRIISDKLNKMGVVGDSVNAVVDKLLKYYPAASTGFNFITSLIESKNLNESFEYVLWGIPPNATDEDILLTSFEGKPITDENFANKSVDVLTNKGCKNVRVQKIDLGDNKLNFEKSLNEANISFPKELVFVKDCYINFGSLSKEVLGGTVAELTGVGGSYANYNIKTSTGDIKAVYSLSAIKKMVSDGKIKEFSLNEANNYSDDIAKLEEQAKMLRTQAKTDKRDADLADLKKQMDELKVKGDEEELQKVQVKIDAINREIQLEKNQEKLDALKKQASTLEARKKQLQEIIDGAKKAITDTASTADELMTDPTIDTLFKK